MGISLMLKGISFQVFKAEYETPLLAYSRLHLGISIFLQNLVFYLELLVSLVHFWEWNTAPHLVLAS